MLPADLDLRVTVDDLEALGEGEQPAMNRMLNPFELLNRKDKKEEDEVEWAFTEYPR